MIKVYITGGAKTGGHGKLKRGKGEWVPDAEMTGDDYKVLAQKHIAMASQKIDRVDGRIDKLQAFCAVPRAEARHTLHPSHVMHTHESGEQKAQRRDRERAKHDIAAFNRLKAQGGAQATNAVARFERTAEKMAWLPAPAGGAAEEKAPCPDPETERHV